MAGKSTGFVIRTKVGSGVVVAVSGFTKAGVAALANVRGNAADFPIGERAVGTCVVVDSD